MVSAPWFLHYFWEAETYPLLRDMELEFLYGCGAKSVFRPWGSGHIGMPFPLEMFYTTIASSFQIICKLMSEIVPQSWPLGEGNTGAVSRPVRSLVYLLDLVRQSTRLHAPPRLLLEIPDLRARLLCYFPASLGCEPA